MKYDVIVVGGGPAGLLCAGKAASRGKKVLVIEKRSRPARKILVTGKGRCNVTNHCEAEDFIASVRTNPFFLYSSYYGFTAQDAMALFEGLGVPLKVERGNRVFPVSDKARDIANALVAYAKGQGALIHQYTASSLLFYDGKVKGVLTENGVNLYAKSVVVATGGKSYPLTGSTGDGYRFAEQVGHSIKPLRPSLVAILTKEKWPAEVMGLTLRNVTLSLWLGQKKVYSELGEMLFTHFGVSGPLVLSASAHLQEAPEKYHMTIDLKPGLREEQLEARLLRDFEEFSNKDFSNALDKLLPKKLADVLVKLTGIAPGTKVNQITKEQRREIRTLLKSLPLSPKELGSLDEAVITAGGVNVEEIDPKTMQSKLADGLYFAGEVLDLDAYTGGFNLQIAYSTGMAAGTFC